MIPRRRDKRTIAQDALGGLQMKLSERLLLSLSVEPGVAASKDGTGQWTLGNALSTLERVYPDFQHLIQGKRILDFGCG